MYYTLAKEEPGHASLMRIYLRSDSEGAGLPSILPEHSISLSPLEHCPFPCQQHVLYRGGRAPGGHWDGYWDGALPCQGHTRPLLIANVAQSDAHNLLPRANEKIITAGKELQTHLEASGPLLGFLACGKA